MGEDVIFRNINISSMYIIIHIKSKNILGVKSKHKANIYSLFLLYFYFFLFDSRNTSNQRFWWYVFCYHRTCSYYRTVANSHSRQ